MVVAPRFSYTDDHELMYLRTGTFVLLYLVLRDVHVLRRQNNAYSGKLLIRLRIPRWIASSRSMNRSATLRGK